MAGDFSFGEITFAMSKFCMNCRLMTEYVGTMPVTSSGGFKGTIHLSYSADGYTPVGPSSIWLDEDDVEYVNVSLVDNGQGGASVLIITGVSGSDMDTEEGQFGST